MSLGIGIAGAYNTKFGKLDDKSLYDLFEEAAKGAVADSGMEAKDIDAVFVGNFSGGGFNHQEHLGPYAVNIFPEMRHKPTYRTESACASSSAAVHMAAMAVKSGLVRNALVVGLEKMTALDSRGVTDVLAMASLWPTEGHKNISFPCLFAEYAKGYSEKFKIDKETMREWLAEIAAKAYRLGAQNELAHMQKERTKEEILGYPDNKNPMIAEPLRLHDCSLVSDGAAALVLSDLETVKKLNPGKAVELAGMYDATDYLDITGGKRSRHHLDGAEVAIQRALEQAGMSIDDMNLAEVHDCFTITELLLYSALGVAENGKEIEALRSGAVDLGGKLPVNVSGGLKAKGHPVGATGTSMHALVYKQITGQPIGAAVENASAGITVNIGGSGASNMVSVLRRAA